LELNGVGLMAPGYVSASRDTYFQLLLAFVHFSIYRTRGVSLDTCAGKDGVSCLIAAAF
jgi:hypothetical protein